MTDLTKITEQFRAALMTAHSHDWSMETISEAAHVCAAALSSPAKGAEPVAHPKCLRDPRYDGNMQGACSAAKCSFPNCREGKSSTAAPVPKVASAVMDERVDYTLSIYKQRDGLFTITSSIPGLLLAGSDLLKLLADIPLSVKMLRELNGHESTQLDTVTTPVLMDLGKVREALEKISDLDCSYEKHWRNEAVEIALDALALLDSLAPDGAAQERMMQAYPTLAQFFSKYALGSKLETSCFCCGHVGERAVTHLELPDLYVCKTCKDATERAPDGAEGV